LFIINYLDLIIRFSDVLVLYIASSRLIDITTRLTDYSGIKKEEVCRRDWRTEPG